MYGYKERMNKMAIRTDLALEKRELAGDCEGVQSEEETFGEAKVTRIKITNEAGEKAVGKPVGNYITIEMRPFSNESSVEDSRREAVSKELERLLPKEGTMLVAGLGNCDITPDALGPKTGGKIFTTRHISDEHAGSVGLGKLRAVCALAPGVLGKTGIELAEILLGVVRKIQPAAVVVVDALASRNLSRLGSTVQLSDTGICPGSGVGNSRSEISEKTLGIPVVSVGVPTVVDAATLAEELLGSGDLGDQKDKAGQMMVTPREIDAVIDHAAGLLSLSINCALHPHLAAEDLMALV